MPYNYDALYAETPNALGAPTQVIVDFFAGYDGPSLRILDIGCGQGRDAVFLGKLGHSVTGVDLSPHGIADLIATAEAEDLPITGIVADITAFTPDGVFDVILIDRTLHMLDRAPRLEVLQRLLGHVAADGQLLIADEASNIADFVAVCEADRSTWATLLQKNGYLFLQKQDAAPLA